MKELSILTTPDFIATKILFLRDEKVLLDADLALLYGVETRVLKQAVRRNINRFPEDFMFQLTPDEFTNLRSQFVTSSLPAVKAGWGGQRYPPFAFTEQGVAMLSGILNSPQAIETNIAIMRTFVALRKLMETNKDLAAKIRQLERKYDQRFKLVFDAIQKLLKEDKEASPIGFQLRAKGKKK